jgi:hypothetical protein
MLYEDEYEELRVAPELGECVAGIIRRCATEPKIIYDYDKVVDLIGKEKLEGLYLLNRNFKMEDMDDRMTMTGYNDLIIGLVEHEGDPSVVCYLYDDIIQRGIEDSEESIKENLQEFELELDKIKSGKAEESPYVSEEHVEDLIRQEKERDPYTESVEDFEYNKIGGWVGEIDTPYFLERLDYPVSY